jgi:hypothetical protein
MRTNADHDDADLLKGLEHDIHGYFSVVSSKRFEMARTALRTFNIFHVPNFRSVDPACPATESPT